MGSVRPICSLWVEGSDIAGVGVRHRPQPFILRGGKGKNSNYSDTHRRSRGCKTHYEMVTVYVVTRRTRPGRGGTICNE
jgi:hypothetical protein